MRRGHVPAGGHVAGLWMFFKNDSALRCCAVFCGVLRCFVCVFLAFVFTKQHKTDHTKYTKNEQKEQNTLCAIQRNTVLRIFLSLRKCVHKNHSQNTPTSKKLQNTRKTPFIFTKHSQNTTKHKTPANHPQNTAKLHRTHLL